MESNSFTPNGIDTSKINGGNKYKNGDGITAGKYSIEVYMDGIKIGSTETILR